jgi:imidazolonepropionase-like amidohydrolase
MSDIIFANATVLDVVAGELLGNRHVRICEREIAEVSETPIAAADARVLDLRGATLMPGLCDAHVHVTAATASFPLLATWSPSYVAAHASELLEAMVMRGFTTVRDAGGADWGLAKAVAEDMIKGPRLLFCGHALSQTGGHGDMRGPGEHALEDCFCCAGLGTVCDGVAEVRRACRHEIRKGATHIKLMVSGGVSSPTDRITSTQFSEEEIRAAVEEAEAALVPVMAHAYTARAANRAIRCGVDSIEHGNLIDQSTVDLFNEHGAFLVPTLSTYQALAKEGVEAGMPPELNAKVFDVLDAGIKAVDLAYRGGVKMVYGTDLLGMMQRHQLNEFALRAEAVKPADILRAATCNAAELFRMSDRIGRVEPGLLADLIVVDGNPLENLGVMRDPGRHLKLVMKEGRLYKDALD